MQLPTIAQLNSSDTEDDEAEVEVFLPSKQFGNTAVDLDAVISAAEGTIAFSELGTSCAGASVGRSVSSSYQSLSSGCGSTLHLKGLFQANYTLTTCESQRD
jgi:hypothetical protein